jgi:hypothetical protein
MILKIKKGVIYSCEPGVEDKPIGSIFENATEEEERLIECGSEVIPAVEEFIKNVNSGTFKPRSVVKEFENILQKYAV